MARVPPVTQHEIDRIAEAVQRFGELHYTTERARTKGFESVPTIESILEILRGGTALCELASVMLGRQQMAAYEAETKARLQERFEMEQKKGKSNVAE
jgi:hypothetical protein